MPRCYAAAVDSVRGRNIMVLEDLAGIARFRDIREPVTATEAEAVVDAMADQHAAFWDSDRFAGDLSPLATRFSPAAMAVGNVVRRRFLGNMKGEAADIVPERIQRQGRISFERAPEVDAFWASEPQTVLHGDPHLGNLFFEGAAPGSSTGRWPGPEWACATSPTSSPHPSTPTWPARSSAGSWSATSPALDAAGIPVDLDHQWTLYRAGPTDFYGSAVAASEAGDRAQDPEVTRVGVERVVAAIEALDSFTVLEALVDGKQV